MPYGVIRKLLSEELSEFHDVVLIESPFKETTRNGRHLHSVLLALTPNKFVIASKIKFKAESGKYVYMNNKSLRLRCLYQLYPLETVKLSVFKRNQKQSLKACFDNNAVKYYELGELEKRKIFWSLWCKHVKELSSWPKLWPFVTTTKYAFESCQQFWHNVDYLELQTTQNENQEKTRLKWTDKHIYLGSKRKVEDKIRPTPIPGLGPTEEIKLLYLKPQYFGCWDQSEHWVQCEDSVREIISK